MPPRKRTACNPRKPRLLFLESPLEGAVHDYGPAPPRAEKTKSVPSKALEPGASSSWVSPQFDQVVELHFPARQPRRCRHVSSNSTVQSCGVTRGQQRAAGRKPSVCKFPSLSFSAAEILETQSFCTTQRRPEQKRTEPIPAPASPPAASFSPPDIRTPEPNPPPAGEGAEIQTPLSRRWDDPCDTQDPGRVLAEDTPEHEYGIRPTWRRRQRLMRYLKSRGRLKSSEILVKP
ncbi:RAD9, HUS1, RAD1-interacting nuclear orphan protein 1 [Dendropsophus ebraccatus]|uniref:RAD9, HUS1, RAD1-interacting nuclear orphan protein 1 n=1 Tax=Dendropsophus ebraccatus TaxID=150705 RepID=UPI0038320BF7